ncbi:MAG: hypothetical protein GY903_11960 [Fuerstiella sp.]|nr:hypothetical protein [Fuerstiella sp.]MCP4855197.1 hypothetical protein [Fuerstiella sp.]
MMTYLIFTDVLVAGLGNLQGAEVNKNRNDDVRLQIAAATAWRVQIPEGESHATIEYDVREPAVLRQLARLLREDAKPAEPQILPVDEDSVTVNCQFFGIDEEPIPIRCELTLTQLLVIRDDRKHLTSLPSDELYRRLTKHRFDFSDSRHRASQESHRRIEGAHPREPERRTAPQRGIVRRGLPTRTRKRHDPPERDRSTHRRTAPLCTQLPTLSDAEE